MKSVLISIHPKWCELIANGKKTVEVRKTRPKIETPFKCYIYCTNTKPYLVWGDVFRGNWETEFTHLSGYNRKAAEEIWDVFNGKVIGEFVCDSIFPIRVFENGTIQDYMFHNIDKSCVPYDDIANYIGKDQTGYGWHISDLLIYDQPRELNEFKGLCKVDRDCQQCPFYDYTRMDCNGRTITHPPQSWCYVDPIT